MKNNWLCNTLLFLCLLVPTSSSSHADRRTVLRVAYFNLDPHVTHRNGGARGPALDYLSNLADEMQVRIEVQAHPLPLDRLLIEMKAGKVDAAVALARSEQRQQVYQFPPKAFFRMQPAIAVPRTAHSGKFDAALLRGMRIGAYSGGYLSPLIDNAHVHLEALHGNDVTARNLAKLMKGRLDGVYSPDAEDLRTAVAKLHLQDDVRIVLLPEPSVGMFTVFSNRVPATIIKRYAKALRKARPYVPNAFGIGATENAARRLAVGA